MMPDPGSKEYEVMIDFMRADLECNMGYSKIIKAAKDRMKAEGRDFDAEFKKWKEDRDASSTENS